MSKILIQNATIVNEDQIYNADLKISDGFIEQIGYTPFAKPKTGECKYCTHWEKLNYEAPRQGWCNHFKNWTDADEYCSRYVRGEENDKG